VTARGVRQKDDPLCCGTTVGACAPRLIDWKDMLASVEALDLERTLCSGAVRSRARVVRPDEDGVDGA
jgi:hypothetical protein